ncbi:MAG: RnfABCDGE type electron transport complex subunit D [Anaerovoracaceae bacterium]|jgi:electron transport complex protein RnfD
MDSKTSYTNLTVTSSPHLVTKLDTQKTMMMVLIALVPSFAMSIYVFGYTSIILMAVCILSCVFFEWAYEKLMHRPSTVSDLSACVTGAILACNLPANFPIWMAIIGCFASIVIVKQIFGGIGRNFANPAIVGRIVLLLSFTTQMTTWPTVHSSGYDATTGATPLGQLQEGTLKVVPLKDEFLGLVGGSMGEISAIAILIGGCFLIWKKIISPIIPCTFIGTVFVFALIYYAIVGGVGDANAFEMALFHVCAGGVMFGAFFCATDYVTSPTMKKGKFIFAVGCGAVTMIIRLWCQYPEGVSFAILFMNCLTPLIDKKVTESFYSKRYGGGAKKDEK